MPGSNEQVPLIPEEMRSLAQRGSPSSLNRWFRKKKGEDHEVDELLDAKVPVGLPSIYAAVLAASFGGVQIHIDPTKESLVHPFFLILFCAPVFVVQLSTITALRTDLDIEKHVWEGDDDTSSHLLILKLAMIVVVYLMNFQVLLEAVHNIIFLLNPMTWAEVARAESDEWFGIDWIASKLPHRKLESAFKLVVSGGPWGFLAGVLNLTINYTVCTDCVSVILSSEDSKGAVFDALAISFIVDLGRYWWEVVQYIFNLTDVSDFKFKVYSPKSLYEDDASGALILRPLGPGRDLSQVRKQFLRALGSCWLGRSLSLHHGARRVIHMLSVTSLVLFCYSRQLVVVLHAVQTNVLPVARDVCTLATIEKSNTTISSFLVKNVFNHLVVTDPEVDLAAVENKAQFSVRCTGAKPGKMTSSSSSRASAVLEDSVDREEGIYIRLHATETLGLLSDYWPVFLCFFMITFLLIFLPHIANCVYKRNNQANDSDAATNRELAMMYDFLHHGDAPMSTEIEKLDSHRQEQSKRLEVQEKRLAELKGQIEKALSELNKLDPA